MTARHALLCSFLAAGLVMTACSKAPEEPSPVGSALPVPPDGPAATPASGSTEGVASTDAGEAAGLVGTTWEIGPYVLEFREPPEVQISGDAVPIPGGVKGQYSVKDGVIEVGAVGQSKAGTWDGTTLVMDGVEGTKQ